MTKDSPQAPHPTPDGLPADLSCETLCAQALGWLSAPWHGLAPAIHPSSTFERGPDGGYPGGRMYARDQSPAYDQVEALLCALEGGHQALLFSSGMAAASALLQALPCGSTVLAPRAMYWGLRKWLHELGRRGLIRPLFYDNADGAALAAQIAESRPALLWVETPANPTWELTDITAACAAAHQHGCPVAVDATVATPILTQPLTLGADFVLHSATKYLNGHSDLLAGALVCAADSPLWAQVRLNRHQGGALPGSFEAWLLLRGMRTLALRVRQASQSALRIAHTCAQDARIHSVLYPGLPAHPGHEIATRQMQGGFGGMLSIRLAAGEEAAIAAAGRMRIFKQATSLGSVESLVEHRASVEGPDTPCPRDLLRLSIGIEQVDDLLADLDQALG